MTSQKDKDEGGQKTDAAPQRDGGQKGIEGGGGPKIG